MRYLKFVVGNNEIVRGFKNSENSPVVGTIHYDGYDIEISECSYKEKYRIWRRRKSFLGLSRGISMGVKEIRHDGLS